MLENNETAEVIPLFPREDASRPSPAESLRLIRAFMVIADAEQRLGIIEWVEQIAARDGSFTP